MNGSLESRVGRETDRQVELVSNVNLYRAGQIMGRIEEANKRFGFLKGDEQTVLIERNHKYLEELLGKVLPVLCPRHIVSYSDHHLPHYVVKDGRMETYRNLDTESPVVEVITRLKHPDSIAEKVSRKTAVYGRVSERHNKYKCMVGDIIGFEVVVRRPEDVAGMVRTVLKMPFLKLENYEQHRKANGYNSDHLNVVYENGNAAMRGLELEIQVTAQQNHDYSKTRPEQAHGLAYGASKLGSRHQRLGQLVIFGNSVTVPKDRCEVVETDDLLIAKVMSDIQPYLLVVPRSN
jgi:hypothetical protein